METPIRWAENDPLENWMFKLLCLDAEIVDARTLVNFEPKKLEHQLLNKEQLVANSELLNEVFSLLVLAHYRTRPNDLKKLLDEENLFLYATLHHGHVIAVALVVAEGLFSGSLSTLIYRGERRPQGHLLAQALTYHCGLEHAARLDYARIMRIAVHPELQHQGIGTALLDYIVINEKSRGRDAIGTSFGMNVSLLDFWRKSNFTVVRIGFTREQTSGEHAAIMLFPLSDQGEKINQQAHTQFVEKCPYWFSDILKALPLEIKNIFLSETKESFELNDFDKKDLHSFVKYSRNYELCIAALNKFVMIKYDEIKQESFPDNFRQVLTEKVINKTSWKDIGNAMALSGQNEARKLFHSAILYFMEIS
jgi:tRNA(Met) cytidine acetyltransferase